MNTPAATERRLLDATLDIARGFGLTVRAVKAEAARGPAHAGAMVRIGAGVGAKLYAVEIKRALRPATLGATLHRLQRLGKHALLVADYITPPMADTLRAHGVPFIDAAGNAYLEQPGTLVWVKGQKPAAPSVHPALGRAFQPTGLQVLFALLCNPALINRPYRELAAMAGVAHGTVGWVIPDLVQQGFVGELKGKRGARKMFQMERLLAQWVDAYTRQLRPRLLIGRYYIPALEGWKNWKLAPHAALWGGEPAGALITEHLRPGELTIYAEKLPGRLAAERKFLKEPAPGHTAVVEVRRKFWRFKHEERKGVVPPVLIYADLLATADARCIETARMVYEAHVARLFAER